MESTKLPNPANPERNPEPTVGRPDTSSSDASDGAPATEEDIGTEGAGTEPRTTANPSDQRDTSRLRSKNEP